MLNLKYISSITFTIGRKKLHKNEMSKKQYAKVYPPPQKKMIHHKINSTVLSERYCDTFRIKDLKF